MPGLAHPPATDPLVPLRSPGDPRLLELTAPIGVPMSTGAYVLKARLTPLLSKRAAAAPVQARERTGAVV